MEFFVGYAARDLIDVMGVLHTEKSGGVVERIELDQIGQGGQRILVRTLHVEFWTEERRRHCEI